LLDGFGFAAAQGFADWAYELGTGRARPGGFR
jgi:hypothetical protein